MRDLLIYNTLSHRKELFVPVNPGHVGMYVCGPTVYGDAHLGHARPGVTYDILQKLFRHLGYKVRYVRNITDVGHLEHDADEGEDKIAKKARLEELEPMEVVQTYTLRYHEAMRQLNVAPPSIEPRASGHIVEQIEAVKKILGYFPSNNMEMPPVYECTDDPNRTCPELETIIPDNPNKAYDMYEIIKSLADNGELFDISSTFARNIITCFIRMNGQSVGVIANQPKVGAGCLDIDASDKAARFIRRCDAYNIPMLTICDVPGFLPGVGQEYGGIIRHGAKMLYAYSEATVPMVTLITRKAYGGAYVAMCNKDLGSDVNLAWPTAQVAVMGASGAVNIISSIKKEIKAAADPIGMTKEKVAEYEENFNNPYVAAKLGYVDDVIEPAESRQRIISAFDMLASKRVSLPAKKHGNIPL